MDGKMLNVRYCLWRLSTWLSEGLLNIENRLCPTTLHSETWLDDVPPFDYENNLGYAAFLAQKYDPNSPIDLYPVSLYSPELTQDSDNAT